MSDDSDVPLTVASAVGSVVKRVRKEHRVTRDALARAGSAFGASWGQTTIENIERGKFSPTISTLYVLCRALSSQTSRTFHLLDLLPESGQIVIADGFAIPAVRLREFLGDSSVLSTVGDKLDEFEMQLKTPAAPPALAELRAAHRLNISVDELREQAFKVWGESLEEVVSHSLTPEANAQARGHETRRRVQELRESFGWKWDADPDG